MQNDDNDDVMIEIVNWTGSLPEKSKVEFTLTWDRVVSKYS